MKSKSVLSVALIWRLTVWLFALVRIYELLLANTASIFGVSSQAVVEGD